MALNDQQIAGILGALCLPYLVWQNLRILLKGELYVYDNADKVKAHYTRAAQPRRYWMHVAIMIGLLLLFTGVTIWGLSAFRRVKN